MYDVWSHEHQTSKFLQDYMKSKAVTHFYSFVHLDIISSSRTVPLRDTGVGFTETFTFLYDALLLRNLTKRGINFIHSRDKYGIKSNFTDRFAW
jgi:hypothetical protein